MSDDAPADSFDWRRHWYPVATAADLDPDAPHSITLLGEDMVLWHDGNNWATLADRCPHRLAPLSEGRLQQRAGDEQGAPRRLQCAYHGWEFQREGACTRIPQALSEQAEAAALQNARSCVRSFPTAEGAGLLWVWAQDGPDAQAEASSTPLPLPSCVKERLAGAGLGRGFFMRDLPYGHDILLENLVDPSHLPFSHHGVGGLKREGVTAGHRMQSVSLKTLRSIASNPDANTSDCPIAVNVAKRVAADEPTAAAYTKSVFGGPDDMSGVVHFTAPGRVIYEYPRDFNVVLFATPTEPGRSRVFLVNLAPVAPKGGSLTANAKRMAMRTLFKLITGTWLGEYRFHMMDNTIFDGDGIFLTSQQHKLHSEDAGGAVGGGSQRSYFMPAPADALVVAMRRWYEGPGGGQPSWRGAHAFRAAPPPTLHPLQQRSELLDRWNQHTKGCRICLAAHRRLTLASRAVVAISCAAAAYWFGAVGAGHLGPVSAASAKVWSLVGAGGMAYRLLQRERQTFHFVDYVHAHK